MKYQTVLIIALAQFIIMLPTFIYLLSLNYVGVSFTVFMLSGMFTIITLYYPLININDQKGKDNEQHDKNKRQNKLYR